MQKLLFRSIREHAAAFSGGEYTSEELTRAFLRQIETVDGRVGAYLTVDAEGALLAARASDERRRRGESLGPLDGIPYSVKDNFCTKDLRTTCASRMLESYCPPYDAEAVCRLRRAGAVLLGKVNLDEFAMGSSTEHSALGRTRNPYGEDRVAGGSSGGSAAAVAAGECVFSLGTDTGGSIRQPAAFCGVMGLKPTYGAISRYGVIALASSLDCVGVFSRSAEDGETVLSALVGRDEKDMTTLDVPPSSIPDRPLRVAVVTDFLQEGMVSDDVRACLLAAVSLLRESGLAIGEVTLPEPSMALAAYSVLTSAEAASELGRYDGVRYGLSPCRRHARASLRRESGRGLWARGQAQAPLWHLRSDGGKPRDAVRSRKARSAGGQAGDGGDPFLLRSDLSPRHTHVGLFGKRTPHACGNVPLGSLHRLRKPCGTALAGHSRGR